MTIKGLLMAGVVALAANAAGAEGLKTGLDGTFAPHAMPKDRKSVV